MDTTDEVPDWAKVWLDRDVAEFLHLIADKHFGGNVALALNEMVRITMAMYNKPDDKWTAVEAHKRAHLRGQREAEWRRLRR